AYNYYYDYCKQYTFTTAIRMVAMEIFSDWITQIVLFILLGTVIELLLPDTRMKKYVNLILGLLLLLILSKPILYLFSVDTERSEEHTSELQSRFDIACRLLR